MEKLLILALVCSFTLSCEKKKNQSGDKSNYQHRLPSNPVEKPMEKSTTDTPQSVLEKGIAVKDLGKTITVSNVNDQLKITVNQIEVPVKIRLADDDNWKKQVANQLSENDIRLEDFQYKYYIDLPTTNDAKTVEFISTNLPEETLISFSDGYNIQEEFTYNNINVKKTLHTSASKLYFDFKVPLYKSEKQFHFFLKEDNELTEVIAERSNSIKNILLFLKKESVVKEFEDSTLLKQLYLINEIKPDKKFWQLVNTDVKNLDDANIKSDFVYLVKTSRLDLSKDLKLKKELMFDKNDSTFKLTFKNTEYIKLSLNGKMTVNENEIKETIELKSKSHLFTYHLKTTTKSLDIEKLHFFINSKPVSLSELNETNFNIDKEYTLEIKPISNICKVLKEGRKSSYTEAGEYVGQLNFGSFGQDKDVNKCDVYKINLELLYQEVI